MIIKVYHSSYGCETGCCGHIVEVDGETSFEFAHPYGETDLSKILTWAKELATYVIERDHPECVKDIDWSTAELDATDSC